MKRSIILGLLAALCIPVTAGCGGGGGGSSTPANSPFAGSYSGTFNDVGNAQSGTLKATVATNGQVTGSVTNTTTGNSGGASGSIDNSGNSTLAIAYPGETITDKGTVAFASNGHLTGNVTEFNGSTQVGTATVDLVKQ